LKPWRQDVVAGARVQMGIDRWETAAAAQVGLTFYFVRPKTVSAVKRPHHTVKPDGDKLARAVFDALTVARVVNDDANIVSYSVHKAYSVPGLPPGVRVTVSTL
jgi:Holliday junction resolvase RusA-like endonuclease